MREKMSTETGPLERDGGPMKRTFPLVQDGVTSFVKLSKGADGNSGLRIARLGETEVVPCFFLQEQQLPCYCYFSVFSSSNTARKSTVGRRRERRLGS